MWHRNGSLIREVQQLILNLGQVILKIMYDGRDRIEIEHLSFCNIVGCCLIDSHINIRWDRFRIQFTNRIYLCQELCFHNGFCIKRSLTRQEAQVKIDCRHMIHLGGL